MNKKYKFTGKTIQHEGITLHQIQALRSFTGVDKGELGGWIQTEYNLSHEGDCWVFRDARVYQNAQVCENAQVFGDVWMCGDARAYAKARMYGDAEVYKPAEMVKNHKLSTCILPEELDTLPDSVEEVTIKGVKYKKITKWETV